MINQMAPLRNFVEVNPESVTKTYPHDEILYIDISSVGSGYFAEFPKLFSINESPSRAKRIVRDGDTILATVRPNLRSFMFIKEPDDNTVASTGFAVLRAKDNVVPRFIYYAVTDRRFTGYLTNNTKGTSYPAVDTATVLRGEIPDFNLRQQRIIASILSAYDDLIENNRRRIHLLERAARLLYKEWFVHLRFPGHEHTPITDGVPEGWERKTLGEVGPLNYGKSLKKDDRIPGPFPVFGSSGIIGTHEKSLVPGPAIIVGRKGNVGSTYWSQDDCYPIDTVYFIEAEYCSIHLYHALLNTQFLNTDVAVPGTNRDFAHGQLILVPDNKILALFEQQATPIYEQINRLTKHNQTLAKARDLLLPRLMNGDVAVRKKLAIQKFMATSILE